VGGWGVHRPSAQPLVRASRESAEMIFFGGPLEQLAIDYADPSDAEPDATTHDNVSAMVLEEDTSAAVLTSRGQDIYVFFSRLVVWLVAACLPFAPQVRTLSFYLGCRRRPHALLSAEAARRRGEMMALYREV
jgi:hypothetical protein